MCTGNKILLYSALACGVLMLAPATAAAAGTGGLAGRVAAGPPSGYAVKSVSDISLPGNSTGFEGVTCPKGTVVLSGGAYIDSSSVLTGIDSSFPTTNRTWEVFTANSSGTATTFNVYAVCAKKPKGYVQLAGHAVSSPAGQQTSATLDCGAGRVILGGGVITEDAVVSVVMTSSYPGTSASWTAAESNFSTEGDSINVVAICASASAFHHYAIPSTSASDPAGTQKGIIQACAAPTVALGGGNRSSNASNLRIAIKATQPFPATGTSWKSGENNDTTSGTTLTSYAICAT